MSNEVVDHRVSVHAEGKLWVKIAQQQDSYSGDLSSEQCDWVVILP